MREIRAVCFFVSSLSLVVLLFNSIVISFVRNRRKTPMFVILICIITVDLISVFVPVTLALITAFVRIPLSEDSLLCQVQGYIGVGLAACAIGFEAIFVVERCIALRRPNFYHHLTPKKLGLSMLAVITVLLYLSVLPIFRTGGFAWVPRVFVCTVTLQPYILSVMPEACLLFIQFCMLAAVIGVYRISRAGPHNDVMWLQAALLKYSLSLPLDTGVMLLRCLDAAAVASDGTLLLSLAFALHKIPLAIRAIVHSVFSGQLEKIREAIKSKGKCNVICIRKAKISHRNTPSNMDSANGGGGIAIIGTEGNVRRLTGNVLHVGHIYWARGRNMSRGHLRVSDVTPLAEEESSIDKSEPLVDHVLTQLSGGRNVTMPGFVAQRSPSFKILLDRARSSVGIWRRFSDSCAKRPIQPLLSNKISVDMRLTVDRPFRRNKRLRTQSCPDLRECSSSPVRGRSQVKVSVVLDKANVERVEFSPINAVIRGRSLSCPNQASDVTNTEFDSNCWAAVVNDGYDKQEELSSKRLPNTTPPTLASLGIATLPPVRLPGGPRGLQGQGLTAIIENAELPGMAVYE